MFAGRGTSSGKVDPAFQKRITQLEERAKKISEKFKSLQGPIPWNVPDELKDKELLDVPGLHGPAWDRNGINELYSNKILAGPLKEGGTTGDLIAMKWQADFMATEERAFRTRHASFVRCAAFMHGRLDGHGKPKVSIFSFLKDGVQSFIDAGKS